VKLHYLDWGGQGETLLFLAGLGHNAHIFDDLAPKFTSRFRVLAMTRRGFGLSDEPESGYDIETRVADVLGFLDALKIGRAILVGHSIAGDELTAFAASYPDRVDSLVYLDAAWDRSQESEAEAVRNGKEAPGGPSIPKEALGSVDAYLSYFHKSFSSAWCDAFEASLRDAIMIHADGSVERRTPDRVYRAIRKGSLLASLNYSDVKPRTLSLYEDPSTVDDAQVRQELAKEIEWDIALIKESGPQVQVAQLPGAGHYLFIDHLNDVVNKMNGFLDSTQVAGSARAVPRSYLGFDRNKYPGDAALGVLRKAFSFCGYWLNTPPGETSNTWQGKREALHSSGFGFVVLFNGRRYRELKSLSNPIVLGTRDAAVAVESARKEGFPAGTIIFLDQEEGGRMLPEQRAYVYAWVDGVNASGYRAGVYCSGIPARESGGATVITADDLRDNAQERKIAFFVYNDSCPPSPGCTVPRNLPSPTAEWSLICVDLAIRSVSSKT